MNGVLTGQQQQQGERRRMTCPACTRFLGTVEATYAEYPPCVCGFQTTVKAVGKRARAGLVVGAERIEIKQST